MKKQKPGRKKIDKSEKKVPLQIYVKAKNKSSILKAVLLLAERMDK